MNKILFDLNRPKFQSDFFNLQKDEQRALLNTLKKIAQLSWTDLYCDKGIRWELVKYVKNQLGEDLYTFRFSKKYRCTAYRQANHMILVELFADHDGAYK